MKVLIYYQTVTPESALLGSFAEQGLELTLGNQTVETVLEYLKHEGILEPSASKFHPDIWYTSHDAIQDYITGEMTYYTAHIEEASVEEQELIYKAIVQRKAA